LGAVNYSRIFAGGGGVLEPNPPRKARDECTQYRQVDYTVRGFLQAQQLKVFYFSLVANIPSVGKKKSCKGSNRVRFDSVPFSGIQSEKDLDLNQIGACFFVHAVRFGIILVCGLLYTVVISACQGSS
jgi:hypothetical protein